MIITALAVMIAVAGYINYSDSRLKTQDGSLQAEETADMGEITEDIESLDYDLTDEIAEAAKEETKEDGEMTKKRNSRRMRPPRHRERRS